MIAWLIWGDDISLTRTDGNTCNTLGFISQVELGNALHGCSIPNMNCWEFTTFTSCDDITSFIMWNIQTGNIILMSWPIRNVFFTFTFFFTTTENSLGFISNVMSYTKSSTWVDYFIGVFSKIKSLLVTTTSTSKSVYVVNFKNVIQRFCVWNTGRSCFLRKFQESLGALCLSSFLFCSLH